MEGARKYLVVLEVQVEAPELIDHKIADRLGMRIRNSISLARTGKNGLLRVDNDGLKIKALTVYKPFPASEVTK